MPDFKTELEITADFSSAEKALDVVIHKAGPGLVKAFEKTGETVSRVGGKMKSMSGKAVSGAKAAAKGLGAVGAAAAAAGAVVAKLVDGFNELLAKRGTARLFGGTEEGLKAIQKALDDTVTSTEALYMSATRDSRIQHSESTGRSHQARERYGSAQRRDCRGLACTASGWRSHRPAR